MLPGLKTLLAPLSPGQFRAQYWRRRHYLAPARRGLVRKLAQELADFNVYRLLELSSDSVQAWFTTTEGGFRAAEVSPAAGRAAYDAGVTLYLRQTGVPALDEWQRGLARELGHARENLTCSVFAAKRGAGTRCHFDTLENFTIQLQGTKRWRVQPNRHVQAPLENWVTGDELSGEMELYCETPLPKDMPEQAETIALHPGDVLYLPRGYWHSAEAADDSLSLFLGFPVTPCVELVLNALRSRLLRSALWRENFIDATAGPARATEARRQMAELLCALRTEVAELTVEEAIGGGAEPVALNERTVFRRNPIATLQVQTPRTAGAAEALVTVHRGIYSREHSLKLGRNLLPLCRWLAQQRASFSLTEAAAQAGRLPQETVHKLLRLLCRCGFLAVCADGQERLP